MNTVLKALGSNIDSHFGNNLECAIIFGSVARNEHGRHSDIDLLIVLKDTKSAACEIESFKKIFIDFQDRHGFVADTVFPGEYCSKWDIEKSIKGFGFVSSSELVYVDRIFASDWNSFNEYRQWLSALAGPNIPIAGDRTRYDTWRQRCLETSLMIHLLAQSRDTFSMAEILDGLATGGKEYLGYVDTPGTRRFLESWIPTALQQLENKETMSVMADGNIIFSRQSCLEKLPYLLDEEEYELQKRSLGGLAPASEVELLHRAIDEGIAFLSDDSAPVINFRPETDIRDQFTGPVPIDPTSLTDIVGEYRQTILDGSIRQGSKNYLAFPDSGNATAALLGGIYEIFTNQNLIATTKSAPTGTYAEIQVIRWIRSLIGYGNAEMFPANALEVGGIALGGGTMANAVAILAARSKAFPESRLKGMWNIGITPILLVAGETFYHYSHIASFWWLGMGEENIVLIKMLDNYRMDPQDLAEKLRIHNSAGSKVVAVICQAGDSRTTTIEHFREIHAVTSAHDAWLHVDACHGGTLLFSDKLRHKIAGIELADSISIDPHKGLCVPYASSLLLFKRPEDVRLLSKSTDITIRKGSSDLGQITPFLGSKPFDSLKLWFLIKNLGVRGIGTLVEYRHRIANDWRDEVENSRFFLAINEVELNSVVFSVSPQKLLAEYPDIAPTQTLINELNAAIHDRTYQRGRLCIHTFDIIDIRERLFKGKAKVRVLGITIGNPNTSASDFLEYISSLEEIVREYMAS